MPINKCRLCGNKVYSFLELPIFLCIDCKDKYTSYSKILRRKLDNGSIVVPLSMTRKEFIKQQVENLIKKEVRRQW